MSNAFYQLFLKIQKYPKTALFTSLLFLVGMLFVVQKLQFNEDITRIIPHTNIETSSTEIVSQMNFTDKIAVIFKKKEPLVADEDLSNVAQVFTDTLPVLQEYYESVQGVLNEDLFQLSFDFVYRNLPLYLNNADYQQIALKLNKDSIAQQVDKNHEQLLSGSAAVMKDVIVNDPLQLSFLALQKLQQFQGNEGFKFQDGFLFSNDGQKIILFINPKFAGSETENNQLFITALNELKQHLNDTHPTVEVSYFGSPFIAVANAEQIKTDIFTTVALSVAALMLLLIFYYRNWFVPVLVMIPSVFGGLFGLLCLYFLRSEISAISLSIAAILIGITIDYALHFLTHSKNNQHNAELFKNVTKPLLMSSSTTAVAFLCLLFVHSDALIDLGIFASVSVIATAVFTLIILPHIYKGKGLQHVHVIDKIAAYPFEKNKLLICVSLLLLIISAFTYHKVAFDGDLSKINFMPKEQLLAEKELYNNHEIAKKLFVVTYHDKEEKLLQQTHEISDQLKNDQRVQHIQSISTLLPSKEEQLKAIDRWQQFWTHQRVDQTIASIEKSSVAKGFNEQTHEPFYQLLKKAFTPIGIDTIKSFNNELSKEFIHGKQPQIVSTVVTIDPKDRDAFVADFEQYNKNQQVILIDRQALNEQYLGYLINDFNALVSYSFVAVIVILFVFYRRIELVIVAAIPIGLTGFVTAGIMGLLQIPFNIFSTIVCTLVFGHGIDFTIFMTSALQKQYTDGKNEMPLYRTSIILAVLTTILAIGALIFAKHPALKSIALIALIGVSVAVLITFVLYPLLFKFLFFNRVKKGLSPVSLSLVMQSLLMFAYYTLASLAVSIFMRGVFWILPFSKQKKWHVFSNIMSAYMKSVLYLKPTISKRIFNKERLSEQSVIISNHTSFLDSLTIGMTHSKVVYIVNDWVYKSPVFGRAVKFLGFYPATKGVEHGLEPLEERIGNDFSVMIFPEGTRSRTSEIGRFHKGAFFMAEELQLPIQPVYIHGNADLLPKGDFIIYNAICHVYVGEPIAVNDVRFGIGYAERTKNISKYFKAEYTKIRLNAESADYFKEKLFLNFLYKEYGILSKVKQDFSTHKEIYHGLFSLIDDKAKIAHITADLGQIDFLLVNQFPTRKITTFNSNEEHRSISKASYINNKFKIRYVNAVAEVWQRNTVLILSHLSAFNEEIPVTIQQIIVVCCTFDTIFEGFARIDNKMGVHIFQRVN